MLAHNARRSCVQRMFARYFSSAGQRFSGYVTYYHPEENFGFVVRDDQPEKEYHFTGADLQAESILKVRAFAQVEFSTLETGYGRCLARDVSAPMGRTLSFRHANLRLPEDQRTLKLSDLSEGGQRFTGVVIHVSDDNRRGYVIPDKLQYKVCAFDMKDLWVTGQRRIPLHAEVEFTVYSRESHKMNQAYQITRPGGGIITAEHKYLGGIRRSLGQQYKAQDKLALIPRDLPRETGFICDMNEEKLYCMIAPHANAFTKVFCSYDDLHMYGNRRPRLYEPVEFTSEHFPDRIYRKATHVTGPNCEVIKSSFDNDLIPLDRRNRTLLPGDEWHDGVINSLLSKPGNPQDFYGFILPNDIGASRVYFNKFSLVCTDSIRCELNTRVQFKIIEVGDKYQASEVHGYGKIPITSKRGPTGDFYRGHGTAYRDLEPVPLPQERLQGFVANFHPENDSGVIETTSLGSRYQRIEFHLSDVADKPKIIPQGSFVEFDIEESAEPTKAISRAARNIRSVNTKGFDPQVRFKGFENEQEAVKK